MNLFSLRKTTRMCAVIALCGVLSKATAAAATPCPTNDPNADIKVYSNGIVLFGGEFKSEWTDTYMQNAGQQYVEGVTDISNLLKSRGIKLIFVPIPNRATSLEKYVSTTVDTAAMTKVYEDFLTTLGKHGVQYVDVLAALGKVAPYERQALFRETHWTQEGGREVARALAKRLDVPKSGLGLRYYPTQSLRSPNRADVIRVAGECGVDVSPEPFTDYKFVPGKQAVFYSSGFSSIEGDGQWVWSQRQSSKLVFESEGEQGRIKLDFYNPIKDQNIVLKLNGKVIKTFSRANVGRYKFDIETAFLKGMNNLTIGVDHWNGRGSSFAFPDKRPLSLQFFAIGISNPNIDYLKGLEVDANTSSSGEGLLEEKNYDVILVGTSYSQEDYGNNLKFASFIRYFTDHDVLNYAIGAGGSYSSMRDFIESPYISSGGIKYLLWETVLPTGVDTWSDGFNQIKAALQYKFCIQKTAPEAPFNATEFITKTDDSIIKLEFANKSVRSISIYDEHEKISLENNEYAASKNIFYIDLKRFKAGSSLSLLTPDKSKFFLSKCTSR